MIYSTNIGVGAGGARGAIVPPLFKVGGLEYLLAPPTFWPDKKVFCLSDALILLLEKPKVKNFSRLRREYNHSLIDFASGRGALRTF